MGQARIEAAEDHGTSLHLAPGARGGMVLSRRWELAWPATLILDLSVHGVRDLRCGPFRAADAGLPERVTRCPIGRLGEELDRPLVALPIDAGGWAGATLLVEAVRERPAQVTVHAWQLVTQPPRHGDGEEDGRNGDAEPRGVHV